MIFTADIGTTVLKTALFSDEGDLLNTAERPIPLIPHQTRVYHETDAGEWITALREAVRILGIAGEKSIRAIVVSGNGPTLLPVGTDDKPLDMAISWMDRRAAAEAGEVSALTGRRVDPMFYLPKAYWIFKHKPEIYKSAKYFFSCPEYINYLLTGEANTVLPVPEYAPYIWTEELVEKLGMDWKKFPDFVRPGDYLGKTRRTAEERFAVPAGVPVFAGGPDFIVSLLGTGTVAPGRACDRAGTSEGINLCTGKLVEDSRLICVSHIIEGLYNISGIISTSGKALEWAKAATGNTDTSYEELFTEIEHVKPGADRLVFLPYLAGERAPIWDPSARGAFIGLTLRHGRQEMLRAVVESVGYAIRHVIRVMEEMGLSVNDLRVTGSQAKSSCWNQIKADITGKKILVPAMKYSELAGDLAIASFGMGKYSTLAEAAENSVRIEREYTPVSGRRKVYDEMFGIYLDSYGGLKEIFSRLSRQ